MGRAAGKVLLDVSGDDLLSALGMIIGVIVNYPLLFLFVKKKWNKIVLLVLFFSLVFVIGPWITKILFVVYMVHFFMTGV